MLHDIFVDLEIPCSGIVYTTDSTRYKQLYIYYLRWDFSINFVLWSSLV
jgi:hypothetical protein